MGIDAPVTVVWIAPGAPDAEQARALTSWARARGVKLAQPGDEAPSPLTIDPRVAEDVDRLLDRARDAIASRDADAVDRALSAADSTLRAHPEVPQAAWLQAEVERTRSTRLRRIAPIDEAGAARAWARAEALDGGRVTGVGEQGTTTPAAAATLSLDIVPSGAQARFDGAPVAGQTVTTRAGPHALVVSWQGAPVWAGWLETPAGSSTVHVEAPAAPPCSTGDVAQAHASGDGVDAAHVRCGAWVAAMPGPQGIRVGMCEAGQCGPVADWRAPVPWTYVPPEQETSKGRWPAWATWTLVGAGAVVAGSIAIVASGVLKPAPTETQTVTGGVQSH
jgi:hypothetical protein